MPELPEGHAVIALVDDDPSVRQGLQRLIWSGWRRPWGSGRISAPPEGKIDRFQRRPPARGRLRAGRAGTGRSTTKV
jgi:hypothetical protein